MTTEASPGQGVPLKDTGRAPAARGPAAAAVEADTAPGEEAVPARPELPGAVSKGRGRRPGIIVLALAVIAAAGGAVAVAMDRESRAPAPVRPLMRMWQVPAFAADDELIGSWLTEKLLVRASTRGGVRAYDLAYGSEVWRVAPTTKGLEAGASPCAMSPALTAQGLGTIAFGRDSNSCTSLAGLDTATGKILWTTPLVTSAHPTTMAARTYLQGDVATIVSENFLGGLDIRTGRRVWGFHPRGYYCNAYDWGADGIVLVDDYCADRESPFTLTAYDGSTGRVLWTQPQAAHTEVTHILSGAPLIASLQTAGEDSVRIFTPAGQDRKLAVGDTELTPGNGAAADHSARLVGKILVTPALTGDRGEIAAFDTGTGAMLWRYPATALARTAAGDDRVFAVAGSGPPRLVRLDPRTGRATTVAGLPAGDGRRWNFTAGTVYVTPDGGVLELNALGTGGGVRLYQ